MSAARSTLSSSRPATAGTEHLRPLVARLAERLATADGQAILRELQVAGHAIRARRRPVLPSWLKALVMIGRRLRRFRQPAPVPLRPFSDVGIWKAVPGRHGREFVRDLKCQALWRSFADVERIPAKGSRKRVVLFGESAARGLFYDPGYTGAGVLQHMLDQLGGDFEVVDLAKTALTPVFLLRLFRQVAALEPDCLVLFAGNNWHYEFNRNNINPADLGEIASALHRGVAACKEAVERKHIAALAENLLATFAQIAKERGIPAIVVIPEFNLADWHDDYPLPLQKSGSGREWHALKTEAELAVKAGAWDEVERLALAMKKLDDGMTPQPGRFLAQVALARNDRTEARRHLETARDSAGCFPVRSTPRHLAVIRQTVHAVAAQHGLPVVNIPGLMEQAGELPGRKYFLDYCHMSAEGIAFVMRPVSHAVVRALFPDRQGQGEAALRAPQVPSSLAAAAHLLAAIHLGILRQPEEIVSYHLRESLRLDPRMGLVLESYLAARMASLPEWLDADLTARCELSNLQRQLNQFIGYGSLRHTPFRLWDVCSATLSEDWLAGCRAAMAGKLEALLRQRRLNLLDPRFHIDTMHARNEVHHVEKTDRTEFRLLSSPVAVATLSLCCRCPDAAEADSVLSVWMDGVSVWSGPVGPDWRKVAVPLKLLPASAAGVTLSLRWPTVSAASPRAWQRAQLAADRGEAPDIYPTFGEIHSAVLTW